MKTYDKNFKIETVNLYKKSGRSMNQIAKELGISTTSISQWVKQYNQEGDQSFPGKGYVKSSEAELRALRQELEHVRQERDILKKAVAIFSKPRGKGMSS